MTDEQKQKLKKVKNNCKRDKYHNMNEEEKQKLKDYQKRILKKHD